MKLLLTLVLLSVAAIAQTKPGDAEKGKAIFIKDGCYQCHGYDGHGGVGPRLAPRPPALATLIAYLRHPAPGGMPVYSPKLVSDAELGDVWAYLKSIPDVTPAKNIPLLAPGTY
jgi:ubiquinol-cytochrome c reductase cytochrome c subunit